MDPADAALRQPINLVGRAPETAGTQRQVYLLNECTPPLILKVPNYARKRSRLSRFKRLIRDRLPLTVHRMVLSEARHQVHTALRADAAAPALPLPAFRGVIQTTDGPGALWEAFTRADGSLCPTLQDEQQRLGDLGVYLPALNDLLAAIFAHDISVIDFRPANVIVTEGRGSRPDLVLIDGFGNTQAIPVRDWFPSLARGRVLRECALFAQRAGLAWDSGSRRFTAA